MIQERIAQVYIRTFFSRYSELTIQKSLQRGKFEEMIILGVIMFDPVVLMARLSVVYHSFRLSNGDPKDRRNFAPDCKTGAVTKCV